MLLTLTNTENILPVQYFSLMLLDMKLAGVNTFLKLLMYSFWLIIVKKAMILRLFHDRLTWTHLSTRSITSRLLPGHPHKTAMLGALCGTLEGKKSDITGLMVHNMYVIL